jgi:pimeloyl-ACP methyl ester carboxylesterase
LEWNKVKIAELDCGTIHYHDLGHGDPLMLVHGFPLDHSQWQNQLEPLSRSFRVIAPDLPGFGRSVRKKPIESIQTFVDDLIELLDAIKVLQVSFCGLSMGGYIGWQFWKHHPYRLNRLIACNTRAAADSETVARARRVTAHNVRSEGLAKLADDMVSRLFAPKNLTEMPDQVEQVRRVIRNTNVEIVAQSLEAMAIRPDATSWLSAIENPILFVAGAEDVVTPASEMQENAALPFRAEFVILSGAGHLSPLENSQAFNQAVLAFMKKEF